MDSNQQQLDTIRAYIKQHDLQGKIAEAVSKCVQILPDDPVDFLAKHLADTASGTPAVSLDDEAVMLFAKADIDHDGVLSRNEIKKFLNTNGGELKQHFLNHQSWADLFNDTDTDASGNITLTEWKALYNKKMGGVAASPSKGASAPAEGDKKDGKKAKKEKKQQAKKETKPKEEDPAALEKARAKLIKAVEKEGGKKGVEIEGASDMGGLAFFCTTLQEPDGDLELLELSFTSMNSEPNPDPEEERRGGASGVGKMVFSAGPKGLAICCNVPKALQEDKDMGEGKTRTAMNAGSWVQEVMDKFEKEAGKLTVGAGANADYATGFIPADPEKGFFALKYKDDCMGAAYAVLTAHNAMPTADSSPGECQGDFEDTY